MGLFPGMKFILETGKGLVAFVRNSSSSVRQANSGLMEDERQEKKYNKSGFNVCRPSGFAGKSSCIIYIPRRT